MNKHILRYILDHIQQHTRVKSIPLRHILDKGDALAYFGFRGLLSDAECAVVTGELEELAELERFMDIHGTKAGD